MRGQERGGEHGRASARKRIGDPRGARAQPRELAQRARRGDREAALRRRPGAAAGAAERDAGHIAGSAILEPTTPSERRAASGSSCRPSAADLVVRTPVDSETHVRAVACAAVRRVTFACQDAAERDACRNVGSALGDAERRTDSGDAERATLREGVVEPTERRRLRRASAGRPPTNARARRVGAPLCVE